MANPTKKLSTWEKDLGFILPNGDPDKKYSENEVEKLRLDGKIIPVDHEIRTQYLKDNGYPVTRHNMHSHELEKDDANDADA